MSIGCISIRMYNWMNVQTRMMSKWAENTGEVIQGYQELNRTILGLNEDEDIKFETTIEDKNDIEVGDKIEITKTLDEEDVKKFAEASGDRNPLHLDEEFAEDTMFGETIVHGTLVSGVISAALARIPGTVIYLSQDLEFRNPVKKGEEVTAVCEVQEKVDSDKYRIKTTVYNEEEDIAIDGNALVMVS